MEVYINRALNISLEKPKNEMDKDSLEAMYRQYYKNVYNYISFRINNHYDSEDLANSVFENAIRKFHTYKPERAPIEAWLIGIAKNVVTDHLRSKKHTVFTPIEDILGLASPSDRPEEVVVRNEDNRALIQAMSKLKDKERQILSMKFSTDLKNHEIAGILGMSESNVGVIVHRSIKKLMKLLEKERV